MYIKITSGGSVYPYNIANLRTDFPSVSFAFPYVDADLATVGVFPVEPGVKPSVNQLTHDVQEVPPTFVGGKWRQQWLVTELPEAQVTANIAAARAARWEAVKVVRARKSMQGGWRVGAHWFHSDAVSRSQFQALVRDADKIESAAGDMNAPMIIPGPGAVPLPPWKTMANTFVPLTAALVQSIVDQAKIQDAAVFARAEQLRLAIEASDNPVSIDIEAGWPETFGGI